MCKSVPREERDDRLGCMIQGWTYEGKEIFLMLHLSRGETWNVSVGGRELKGD